MMVKIPNSRDFEEALERHFAEATAKGHASIEINSSDLHRQVGGYPAADGNHRMPMCCGVMRKKMQTGDKIKEETPSGQSSTLTICYRLPR